jgi:hypothetical protein
MGIGTILMREAEWRIAQLSPIAGIGVGLLAGYGAAQVLYIKRGYIPDRRGIIYQNRQLNYGDQVMVDDDLVLYFTRNVK